MLPKRVGSEQLGPHECLPPLQIQAKPPFQHFYVYLLSFIVLTSLPFAFPSMDDIYVYLIGILCLPILLYGFYTVVRHVAVTFYRSLDNAPPWNINKLPVLFYPRHYRKHGRIKLIPRYPAITCRHIHTAILLLLSGTSNTTALPARLHHQLRHIPWGSPSPDPFMLTHYDISGSLGTSRDPSIIMQALPHFSQLIESDHWDTSYSQPFHLHQVDTDGLFPDDYDPSEIVKALTFGLKSRRLKRSEAPVYFSMLDNPSCYSTLVIDKTEPPLIVDTGASTSISPKRSDFITYRESFMSIRDLSSSNQVHGEGLIQWNVIDTAGNEVSLIVDGCHIPQAEVRLLSPQCLLENEGGNSHQTKEKLTLTLDTGKIMDAHYCPRSKLPCLQLATTFTRTCMTSFWNTTFAFATQNVSKLTTVLSDDNANMSASQKEAILIHQRLSHANFKWLQPLMRDRQWLRINESSDESFRNGSFIPCHTKASTCDVRSLKCISCECAKAHRRSSRVRRQPQAVSEVSDRSLKQGHTVPGACISADHYLSPIEGRLYGTFGRERQGYTCGTIFVDHASGKIFNFPQLSTTANETLVSKRTLKRLALEEGISIRNYHADNGIFASDAFKLDCTYHSQKLSFSGVGAHHQNGVAKRNIKTISHWARANMIHSAFHWPEFATVKLWPQALDYAVWVFNRLPSSTTGLSPNELWSQSRDYSHDLRRAHVFGCPVYVLDPKLQDGGKLPKWSPRARRGMFVGYSKQHSSLVPLGLNITTGKITPQFHVVFDDKFETVVSLPKGTTLRDEWMDILRFDRDCFVDDSLDTPTQLPQEFVQWFKDGDMVELVPSDVPVQNHPQCQPQVLDFDDAIEVINGDDILDEFQRELHLTFLLLPTRYQRESLMIFLFQPLRTSMTLSLSMRKQRETTTIIYLRRTMAAQPERLVAGKTDQQSYENYPSREKPTISVSMPNISLIHQYL